MADPKNAQAKRAEAARQKAMAKSVAEYAYVNVLVEKYPELRGFLKELKAQIKASPTGTITDQEYFSIQSKYDWFKKHDADQVSAEKQMADDALNGTNDYQAAIDVNKVTLQKLADQYGVQMDESSLTAMATQMKYDNWEPDEITAALSQKLQSATTGDFKGAAGTIQTELQQWAAKNGMDIPADTLQRMIASGAFGKQSVDDMKAELRKTYLAGANPAWSDKIAAGADPYDIAAPYRSRAATLLERGDANSVGMDDPYIQRAMQHTDASGKPAVLPLYEFDKMIRSTEEWKRTDNAHATYASVGDDILKMFGFR